jgi:signal transduction histidine kinase
LPAGIELTAYRVVQEGLTNTIRHADARHAEVHVRYCGDQLQVDVRDDGRGGPSTDSGGHGLAGMRERVAAYEGELEAGPCPDGGYRVRALLPVRT